MKSIAVLLDLLHHFHYWVQCDKTHIFPQGKALKHSMKFTDFKRGAYKTNRFYILLMFDLNQVSLVCHQSCSLVIMCILYIIRFEMLICRCFKLITVIWSFCKWFTEYG